MNYLHARLAIGHIVLLSITIAAVVQTQYGQSTTGWQKFVAADGSFSVFFPTTPTVGTATEKSSKGKSVFYTATCANGAFEFQVQETNSDYDMDSEKKLDALTNNLLFKLHVRKVSQADIELSNYKGIELVGINTYRSIKARIFVSDRRSYIVIVGAPYTVQGDEEQIDKFFKSFEIIKDAK